MRGQEGAVQSSACGGEDAIGLRLAKKVGVEVFQQGPQAITEGIKARAGWPQAESQPLQRGGFTAMARPARGAQLAVVHLVEDDFEQEIGGIGEAADAMIRGEKRIEIERRDGAVDETSEVICGQGKVDGEPFRGETVPRGGGETSLRV